MMIVVRGSGPRIPRGSDGWLDALVPTPAESTIPGLMLLATLFTMPRTDPGKRLGVTRQF